MIVSRASRSLFILLGGLFLVTGSFPAGVSEVAAAPFVAGVTPDRRRADIPVIREVKRAKDWQKQALTGISKPYPEHVLRFLKDQGNWFTPFDHPGMTGRYDIRGWHAKAGR